MALFPNDVVLGMTSKNITGERIQIMTPVMPPSNPGGNRWNLNTGGKVLITFRNGGFLFSCCGASDMTSVGAGFESEKEKQSFVQKLFTSVEPGQTYYLIADSTQLRKVDNTNAYPYGSVISLLRELGAKEVDASPNKNHGPNKMHLHVWYPELFKNDAWQKYLHFDRSATPVPLWWHALKETEQKKLLVDSDPIHQQILAATAADNERRRAVQQQANIYLAQRLIVCGKLDDYLKIHGWTKGEKVRDLGSQEATFPAWSSIQHQI